jgi:signal peptidase I
MNPREHVAAALACGLAGDVVRTFGRVRLRVFGTSMVPTILPGDLISVQRAVISEISNGEIVFYARDGRMFAHRVVGCMQSPGGSLLIARGDRLRHNDPPISSSELLGKVISIERGNFQWRPAPCLSRWERMVVHVLRNSDHATYLYLRLAALHPVGALHAVPLLGGANQRQRSAGSAECQV